MIPIITVLTRLVEFVKYLLESWFLQLLLPLLLQFVLQDALLDLRLYLLEPAGVCV
jgi:hypothetical protein